MLNCAGEVARKVDGQVILAGRAFRGVARVFPIERIRSCDLAIFAIAHEFDSRIGRARFEQSTSCIGVFEFLAGEVRCRVHVGNRRIARGLPAIAVENERAGIGGGVGREPEGIRNVLRGGRGVGAVAGIERRREIRDFVVVISRGLAYARDALQRRGSVAGDGRPKKADPRISLLDVIRLAREVGLEEIVFH